MAGARQLERFHASLDRISAAPAFLDRFYDAFIDDHPSVRIHFEGVDMARLKRKLKSSLHVVSLAIDGSPGAADYLAFVGRMHARFRLTPRDFELWTDALVKAVAETDPEYDEAIGTAWRTVLDEAMVRMKDGLARRSRQLDQSTRA